MTAPCQTTPDGNTIYPGLPGETLEAFVAREVAEVQAYLDKHGSPGVAFSPPSSRAGYWEYGR